VFLNLFKKINNIFTTIELTIIYVLGFLIFFLTLLNVFNRYIIKSGAMSWYQEIIIIFYTAIIFWGCSHLARTNSLMRVDILTSKLKNKKVAHLYKLTMYVLCMIVSLLGVYYLSKYALLTKSATPVLGIPSRISFLIAYILPFIGLTFRYIFNILNILENREENNSIERVEN